MEALITIITVTYNCESVIAGTLKSVLTNKPSEVQHIVIDGGSNDGTLERISEWGEYIDLVISEEDEGIYDAMNKGLERATGEFVFFLNAGDQLYDSATLVKLIELLRSSEEDIYYGDTLLVDQNGREIGLRSVESSRKLPARLTWKSLRRGMVVSHQSFIVRRAIAQPYNLNYRSSADIDWVINCLKKAKGIVNTGLVISRFQTGGFSKQQHPLSLRERFSILQHHFGILPNLVNHLIILLRGLWLRLRGKPLN